jgi:hypothetical protein
VQVLLKGVASEGDREHAKISHLFLEKISWITGADVKVVSRGEEVTGSAGVSREEHVCLHVHMWAHVCMHTYTRTW